MNAPSTGHPLLEVTGLARHYDLGGGRALYALDGVSFCLEAGESLGLVGESGCGKSTLVTLLARLADPSAGRIHFDGVDIGAIPAKRFARMAERGALQVVFQDPHESLNPRFTAARAIADPLLRLGKLRGSALAARVAQLAAQVGLPAELLPRYPHQLSGGQKARVNIARAIALSPRLLILDEPTSALDVSVQAVVLQLLDRLRAELGLSYLFVSHDLNVVRLVCARVLVMYLGRVVEAGPAATLLEAPAHPYTRALVAAVPGRRDVGAPALVGDPASPVNPPPERCRLAGRCPLEQPLCVTQAPALREYQPGHWVACHFARPAASAQPLAVGAAS